MKSAPHLDKAQHQEESCETAQNGRFTSAIGSSQRWKEERVGDLCFQQLLSGSRMEPQLTFTLIRFTPVAANSRQQNSLRFICCPVLIICAGHHRSLRWTPGLRGHGPAAFSILPGRKRLFSKTGRRRAVYLGGQEPRSDRGP